MFYPPLDLQVEKRREGSVTKNDTIINVGIIRF